MTIDILELVEAHSTDPTALDHLNLSKKVCQNILDNPETWQVYINRRTKYAPDTRMSVKELDEWFMKMTGLTTHQVHNVIRRLGLAHLRPKQITYREEELKEYYKYRRELAEHIYVLIKGTKSVRNVEMESGINGRTLYRRMMASVHEVFPEIETKRDLNQLAAASREVIAERVRRHEAAKWDEKKLELLTDEEKDEILKIK